MFDVSRKIEVFISSACGERGDGEDRYKYNLVRKALKCQIERTGLANVYTFEHYGASSVDVESHYLSELKKVIYVYS